MNQITNSIKKKLRETVNILPVIMVKKYEKIQVEGEWLALSPLADHYVFEKGKMYWYNQPVLISINHYRRLRRLYQKHGFEGVQLYVNKVTEYINAQQN